MKPFLSLLKSAARSWQADKAPRLAAALAYYTVFAIAPLLLILIATIGLLYRTGDAQRLVLSQAQEFLGTSAATLLQGMLISSNQTAHTTLLLIVGLAVSVFGAIGIIIQLRDALNTVFESPAIKGFKSTIHSYVISLFLILLLGVVMLASLLLTAFITGLSHLVAHYLAVPGIVWELANLGILIGLSIPLFALLFWELPNRHLTWPAIWKGATLTAFLFAIGKFLLGWYLGRAAATSAYGAASSLVLLLLWVYYSAQIFLFGAEYIKAQVITTPAPSLPSPQRVKAIGGVLLEIGFLTLLKRLISRKK